MSGLRKWGRPTRIQPRARASSAAISPISAVSAAGRGLRDATRQASERRITPSSSTFRWLARKRRAGGGDVDDDVGGAGRRGALRWRRGFRRCGKPGCRACARRIAGSSRQYLVAMRSRRPWRWRKSAATSSRSAMVSTSSQTSGTATTTSACAEAEAGEDLGTRFPVGQRLAQQVLAGDAEIDRRLGRARRRSRTPIGSSPRLSGCPASRARYLRVVARAG